MTTNGHKGSFWGDEMFCIMMVVVVTQCVKTHLILYLTLVNCIYINYTSIKLTRQKIIDTSLVSFENCDNDLVKVLLKIQGLK